MVEVTGDLWTYPADWRVITTNGTVKRNGACVMGRGCAKEAKDRYPGFEYKLGVIIMGKTGNRLAVFYDDNLITFPVKHNWWERADSDLIKQSTDELLSFSNHYKHPEIVMPRPGCGNGGLKWEDVKPLLEALPDNVKVITHE